MSPIPPSPSRSNTRRAYRWPALLAAALLVAAGLVAAAPAWAATVDTSAWYNLVNRNSGKAMDVYQNSTADGAQLVQWPTGTATNQQFQFVSAGSGWYRLVARHSGKAIDISGRSTADGATVVQWTDSNATNQQFSVTDTDSGYVQLTNRNSGKPLEVYQSATGDGARLSQSTDTDGAQQQWKLLKVGDSGTSVTSWSIAAPGATGTGCDGVRATLALGTAGGLTLGATRECTTALEPAPIGLVTTAADLSTGLTFVSRSDSTVNVDYTTVAGKQRQRQRTATESRFSFSRGSARLTVTVRVSADGMAYRYELPAAATVTQEASAIQVPTGSPAHLARWQASYENAYAPTTASAAATGDYAYPALFQVGMNWVLLSESDVDGRYSAARLTHTTGTGRFGVSLADTQVVFAGAAATPWRTAVIGTPATIVESTLNDDVAPPSRIADTAWITPGVSAWSWLDGYDTTQKDLTKQKQYVDYAASQRWEYLIVDDGWNTVTWMPELVSYAKSKNIRIILWYRYTDLDTDAERTAEFGRISGWGVSGVKLDFMESDSQNRLRWYDATLAAAAQYRLVVDFHGATIPHGIQRTWPNVLTMEAVRGEEYGSRSLAHVTTLPFTRNAVGSMDYTAMTFQRTQPISQAAELGLAVVYESGLQVFGGSITAYQSRPEAQRFLRQVPTVWDQTRLLSGDPVNGATVARRNGDRWFVGAVLPGTARTVSVPTAFLRSGSWLVETITDSSGGLARSSRTVTAGTPVNVNIAANGGFAMQLCPATSGRTTCDV